MDDIELAVPRFLHNSFGEENPFFVEPAKKRQLLRVAAGLDGRECPLREVEDRIHLIDPLFWLDELPPERPAPGSIRIITINASRPAVAIAEQLRAHYRDRPYVVPRNGVLIEYTGRYRERLFARIAEWGEEPVVTESYFVSFVEMVPRYDVQ